MRCAEYEFHSEKYWQSAYILNRLNRGGVCSRRGGPAPGGCLLWEGVCSWGGESALGASAPGGDSGGVCSRGVSAPGVSAPGGVPAPGGCLLLRGGIPAYTEADPPVNRMTNKCKNITFYWATQTKIFITFLYMSSCCDIQKRLVMTIFKVFHVCL